MKPEEAEVSACAGLMVARIMKTTAQIFMKLGGRGGVNPSNFWRRSWWSSGLWELFQHLAYTLLFTGLIGYAWGIATPTVCVCFSMNAPGCAAPCSSAAPGTPWPRWLGPTGRWEPERADPEEHREDVREAAGSDGVCPVKWQKQRSVSILPGISCRATGLREPLLPRGPQRQRLPSVPDFLLGSQQQSLGLLFTIYLIYFYFNSVFFLMFSYYLFLFYGILYG